MGRAITGSVTTLGDMTISGDDEGTTAVIDAAVLVLVVVVTAWTE